MAEEIKLAEGQELKLEAPNNEGEKEGVSPLEEAKQVLEENKKVLTQLKEERIKLEKTAANIAISGKSFGGQAIEKKEETPKEYAARIMRGG